MISTGPFATNLTVQIHLLCLASCSSSTSVQLGAQLMQARTFVADALCLRHCLHIRPSESPCTELMLIFSFLPQGMYFEAKGQLDQAGEVYSRFQTEFPDHELLEKRKVMRSLTSLLVLCRCVSIVYKLISWLLYHIVEILAQICLVQ